MKFNTFVCTVWRTSFGSLEFILALTLFVVRSRKLRGICQKFRGFLSDRLFEDDRWVKDAENPKKMTTYGCEGQIIVCLW